MKITVLAVGKIKESYILDGIAEYSKRLARFADFSIIETAEYPAQKRNDGDILRSLEQEGAEILKKAEGTLVALAIDGKQFSSPEFADFISEKAVAGVSKITFIIGGSDGLSKEVLSRCEHKISFGRATYPHQLIRLVLCEQIYRAFTIINNHPYHK